MEISQKQVSVEKVNAKLGALKNTIEVQENQIEKYNKNKNITSQTGSHIDRYDENIRI